MFTDRSRTDDKLFLVLLAVPLFFAAARFVDTQSQMDQIALQSKPPVVMIAEVPAPLEAMAANGVTEVEIR